MSAVKGNGKDVNGKTGKDDVKDNSRWIASEFKRLDILNGNGRPSEPSKFQAMPPLEERLKKETRIVHIGEFHGGTRAFSMDNLLGTVQMLREMAERKEKPDVVIINGGLLPSVPRHISSRNQDRMNFLHPAINSVEDAAVVVRPLVNLLLSAIGDGVKVVYVLGEEDGENIKYRKDEKVAEMKNANAIQAKIEALEIEYESFKSRLNAITHSQQITEKKLGLLSERIEKTKGRGALPSLEAEQSELEAKSKKLAKDSNKVQRIAKNKSRQINELQDELRQLGAIRRTHVERLTPEENRKLDTEVQTSYFDLIREMFGYSDALEIFDQRVTVFSLNGVMLGLGHNLTQASAAAKKGEVAAREAIQSKNMLYHLVPEVDALLFSHHPGTKCYSAPRQFGNPGVTHIVQQGTFADPKLMTDAWNRKIKLPQTDSVDRSHFDSGITIVRVDKEGAFSFDMIGYQELYERAKHIHNSENDQLTRRMKGGVDRFMKQKAAKNRKDAQESGTNGNESEMDGESQKALERGYLESELPSKLSDPQLRERVSALLENMTEKSGVIDALAPKRGIVDYRKVRAEIFSDTHIGAGNTLDTFSNYELLEACIMDSRERGLPDILIFGGDMVEGALGSKLNELVARNYISQKEFMKRIEQKAGLSSEERLSAKMEYLTRQTYASPVMVVEEQVNRLTPLLKHAVDVINAGGEVIVVSGNHYNLSQRNENLDEATHLAKDIRHLGGFEQNDPRIHTFSGGWQGSGQVTVKGIPIFGIHHGNGSKDKITGLMDHRISQRRDGFFFVEGHFHTPVFGKDLEGIFLSAPSIAPTIPFVDQAGLASGLRGYTRMDFFVNEDGTHRYRANVMHVFEDQLKKYVKAIDENYLTVLRGIFKQAK